MSVRLKAAFREWTSLPMSELLTMASCRKDWKRISAESSVMSPRRLNRSRDCIELNLFLVEKSYWENRTYNFLRSLCVSTQFTFYYYFFKCILSRSQLVKNQELIDSLCIYNNLHYCSFCFSPNDGSRKGGWWIG